MGDGDFRDGLREYLKTYAFANAAWPDLIALLDSRTPDDLAAWSHAWVDERGRPTIRTEPDRCRTAASSGLSSRSRIRSPIAGCSGISGFK